MEMRQGSQDGKSKVKDQRHILRVRVRECAFVLFTTIYCVFIYLPGTVLGPDDIMVKRQNVCPN